MLFESIDNDDKAELRRRLNENAANVPSFLIDTIIEKTNLRPLKAIISEIDGNIRWIYTVGFPDDSFFGKGQINSRLWSVLEALESGDSQGFSDALTQFYCKTLEYTRVFCANVLGVPQAESVYTPYTDII